MRKITKITLIALIIFIVIIIYYFEDTILDSLKSNINLLLYVALPIIAALSAPFIYSWVSYSFTKPKFSVYFKPTTGKTFEEKKVQEINLFSDKQQLVWVILKNEGKTIKDNWFCEMYFGEIFSLIPIEKTRYKDVDFQKKIYNSKNIRWCCF